MSTPGGTRERSDEARQGLEDLAPGDALREAGQRLLGLLVQRAAQAASDRVDNLTDRLGDVARDGGPGLSALISGGSSAAEGKNPVGGAISGGLRGLTEKVKNVFGGGGGGGSGAKKIKVTNIVEEIDVGLPLRVTYNLWTQFEDFPSFMKKVESVEQASDEKLNWKAQVFWSHRAWEATIIEQVPDSHIVWRSQGQKGHVNGAVTFTALGPNLTRVLVVLEYYPQGLFERTGNIWRAQGRRARLELKHFRRHAMANAILNRDELEGWRGEIRDSEVVRDHEDALREEQSADETDEEGGPDEQAGADSEAGGAAGAGGEQAEPGEADQAEDGEERSGGRAEESGAAEDTEDRDTEDRDEEDDEEDYDADGDYATDEDTDYDSDYDEEAEPEDEREYVEEADDDQAEDGEERRGGAEPAGNGRSGRRRTAGAGARRGR